MCIFAKINFAIMAKNLTLTECNLANTCYQEDCEIIYPKTIADQVIVNTSINQTLTDWINALNIPAETTVIPDYNAGLRVSTINNTQVKVPYLSSLSSGGEGLPLFDDNYFKLDSNNKVQFDLGWALADYVNNQSLEIGSITNLNGDLLTKVSIAHPALSFDNISLTSKMLIRLWLGSYKASEISIPYSVLQSICPDTTYDDFIGTDGISAGEAGLVPAPSTSDVGKFLNSNGSWVTPTNTTYNIFNTTTDGLVPMSGTDTNKFLKGDGTWALPNVTANDNTINLKVLSSLGQNDSFNPLGSETNHNITTDIFGGFTLNQNTDSSIFLPYPQLDWAIRSDTTLEDDSKRNTPGVIRTLIQYSEPCQGEVYLQSGEYRLGRVVSLAKPVYADYRTTGNSRYYPVESDCNGVAFVHVPWQATAIDEMPQASRTTTGGIRLVSDTPQIIAANTPSDTVGRTYPIQLDAHGQAVVNVPWTSGEGGGGAVPTATSSDTGGIKIGFTSVPDNRVYAVQLDTYDKAFVNVPWTDTHTTRSGHYAINTRSDHHTWNYGQTTVLTDITLDVGHTTHCSYTTIINYTLVRANELSAFDLTESSEGVMATKHREYYLVPINLLLPA